MEWYSPSGKLLTPEESKLSSLRENDSEIGVKHDIVEMVTSDGVKMFAVDCSVPINVAVGSPLFVWLLMVLVNGGIGVGCEAIWIRLPCRPCVW